MKLTYPDQELEGFRGKFEAVLQRHASLMAESITTMPGSPEQIREFFGSLGFQAFLPRMEGPDRWQLLLAVAADFLARAVLDSPTFLRARGSRRLRIARAVIDRQIPAFVDDFLRKEFRA